MSETITIFEIGGEVDWRCDGQALPAGSVPLAFLAFRPRRPREATWTGLEHRFLAQPLRDRVRVIASRAVAEVEGVKKINPSRIYWI